MDMNLHVQLPPAAVVRAMLQRCIDTLPADEPAIAAKPRSNSEPAIGAELDGGLYAGLTLHDGDPHRLVLLPDDIEANWADAKAWAEKLGGTLPSRIDALVLFQNLRKEFKAEAYWTNQQHADGPASAWYQFFGWGLQGNGHVDLGLRARAVRRVPL